MRGEVNVGSEVIDTQVKNVGFLDIGVEVLNHPIKRGHLRASVQLCFEARMSALSSRMNLKGQWLIVRRLLPKIVAI